MKQKIFGKVRVITVFYLLIEGMAKNSKSRKSGRESRKPDFSSAGLGPEIG